MQNKPSAHTRLLRPLFAALFFCFTVMATSCKKAPLEAFEATPPGTVLLQGSFVGDGHPLSGTAKLVVDSSGSRQLVFESFRSDNGPDLRVWLSPNTTATPYTELGLLKAVSGQFSYSLPAGFDAAANNHVLIWCKRFSVLFGHAVLK